MSIAYRQKLTSPKWNRFLGMKLRWKDKIRLNNVIWRCWHMQFIKVIINITINITIIIASTSANIIINTMTPGTSKACVRVCQPSGDWQPQQDWGGSHHGGWWGFRRGFKISWDHKDCWIWMIRKQSVDVWYHTGEILEEKDGNYIGWIQEVEVNNYIVISLWIITLYFILIIIHIITTGYFTKIKTTSNGQTFLRTDFLTRYRTSLAL